MKTSLRLLGLAFCILLVPSVAHAGFGLTAATDSYTVDTGAGLVFKVRRTDNGVSTQSAGDLMSLVYNGVEYQDLSRGSQLNSGFDYLYSGVSAVSVDAAVVNSIYVKVTVTAGSLTHYYLARSGDPCIYMGTYFTAEPDTLGLCRFIVRIPYKVLPHGPAPSDLTGNTGAIEASDIFGLADGTTRSKHYSNMRLRDWAYIGATGTNVGVWMVRDNNEGGSGGPFYRCLLNQAGGDQEITYIVNYGETQTEAFRPGILDRYTLVFTTGATPGTLDTSWMGSLGLTGYVGAEGRGIVTGSGLTGRDTNYAYTVGFANATAQYFTDAAVGDGSFTTDRMLPGTYTMKVYKNELAVYTGSVTVAAGTTTTVGPIAITADPSQVVPLWRVGNWDGSPTEFLNGDKVTTMHPSDVRMSDWNPGPYVIGTSTPATGMPCYQWKSVNANQAIQFNLTAAQVAASTIRVGITTAFAGGRPNLKVNTTTTALQSASTQPDSRTLTVGSYRGNNTTYSFNVPASALVVGTNTLTVYPISGSSGTTYLSPGYSLDCIDMYQGGSTVTAPTAPTTLAATGASGQVALAWAASPNATSYAVLRGTASGGPYTAVAAGLTTTGYTDPGLPNGAAYYYVVTASNSSGTSVYSTEASAVTAAIAAPVVSSALTASTQVGQAFTYQITATNGPVSFAATGLPAGLSLDAASGLIFGTARAADTFTVTLAAVNAGGTGTATFSLIVSPAPVAAPVVANVAGLPAKVGANFVFQITATNSPASYAARGLPDGLALDEASGVIAGTPVTPGVFPVTLSATNSGGTGTAATTITVASALPEINLTAPIPLVVAGSGGFAEFTVTRSGDDLSTALVIVYTVKGTAVGGSDYTLLRGTKKLKPGKASANIKVFPLGDGAGPGIKRTVKLTLVSGDSYLVQNGKAKVKIVGR